MCLHVVDEEGSYYKGGASFISTSTAITSAPPYDLITSQSPQLLVPSSLWSRFYIWTSEDANTQTLTSVLFPVPGILLPLVNVWLTDNSMPVSSQMSPLLGGFPSSPYPWPYSISPFYSVLFFLHSSHRSINYTHKHTPKDTPVCLLSTHLLHENMKSMNAGILLCY